MSDIRNLRNSSYTCSCKIFIYNSKVTLINSSKRGAGFAGAQYTRDLQVQVILTKQCRRDTKHTNSKNRSSFSSRAIIIFHIRDSQRRSEGKCTVS